MITIKVCSGSGQGKSTIALTIKQHLESLGFKCDIIDPDGVGDINQTLKTLTERNTKIKIETVQLSRSSVLKNE